MAGAVTNKLFETDAPSQQFRQLWDSWTETEKREAIPTIQEVVGLKGSAANGSLAKGNGRPTLEEVQLYCRRMGHEIDAEQFWLYYDSQNWTKANGQKLKNWRSAVGLWAKSNKTGEGTYSL